MEEIPDITKKCIEIKIKNIENSSHSIVSQNNVNVFKFIIVKMFHTMESKLNNRINFCLYHERNSPSFDYIIHSVKCLIKFDKIYRSTLVDIAQYCILFKIESIDESIFL